MSRIVIKTRSDVSCRFIQSHTLFIYVFGIFRMMQHSTYGSVPKKRQREEFTMHSAVHPRGTMETWYSFFTAGAAY